MKFTQGKIIMLKKFLLLTVLVLSFFSCNLFAHGRSDPGLGQFLGGGLLHDIKWTPLQISIWPLHLCSPCCKPVVYGLAVSPGWLGVASKVYGISCGSFFFLQGENYGVTTGLFTAGGINNALSCGIFNYWEKNNGISIGLANIVVRRYGWNTLQIGVFNKANNGLQIGLLNYNPNALIPWMPLFNFSWYVE